MVCSSLEAEGDWLGRTEVEKPGFAIWRLRGGQAPCISACLLCAHLQELKGSVLVAQPCTEDLGLMSPPSVETTPNMGATCLESLPLVGASPAGSPSSPRDLPEPRVTTEHTNNRIGESARLGSLVWSGLRGTLSPQLEPETLGPEGPTRKRHGFSHQPS